MAFTDTTEKYGKKYDDLFTQTIGELNVEIRDMIREIDRHGMKYLIKQRVPLRRFLIKIAKKLYNKSTSGAWSAAFKASAELFQKVGLAGVKLKGSDLNAFSEIKKNAFDELAAQAQLDATTIWKRLSNYANPSRLYEKQKG